MSDYIYDWLNYEVGMYPFITDIKEDFYNGYKFGCLLFKLYLISMDDFLQNYNDSNDKDIINENYNKLVIHLKETCGIELTQNMIQPILEKKLTSAFNLIYKIKVQHNNKKIHFDQIRTFDIYSDQDELKNRFMNMASFSLETITDNEEEENKKRIIENDRYDRNSRNKKMKSIRFSDENKKEKKNLKHRNSMEELPYEDIDEKKKDDIDDILVPFEKNNISQSQKLEPISHSVPNKNLSNYKNHKNDINYLLNHNIEEENKKELEKRFNVESFSGNLNKMGFSINVPKLKYLNGISNLDMSQNTVMLKIREQLKERLEKKKYENIEKQEILKNQLKQSLYLTKSNESQLFNFKKGHNRVNSTIEFSKTPNLLYNSNSFNTRLMYEKKLKEEMRIKNIEKRRNFFRSLIIKNNEKEKEKEKIEGKKYTIPLLLNSTKSFQKTLFFTELNEQPLDKSIEIAETKKYNLINDYPLIKKIAYQIIDYTFEGFIYQNEKKTDLIELKEFKNWNKRFVEGLPIIERFFDEEDDEIKNIEPVRHQKIKWTIDKEREILDYVNYAGEWDDSYIIPNDVRGKSIEFKEVYDNINEDFEPTKNEIEDVSIPSYQVKNYKFSELISSVLEYKFPNKNVINYNQMVNKWDYIPIKMSLLGYPLSGKKTQSEIINSKFPNIKNISVYDIIKKKENEFKELNEPIENHPKFKTFKPNQIEQMKEEQNKKIEEFLSNNELIKDYLLNNDENKKLDDDILLQLLIEKIESEFPKKDEVELKNEIIKRQQKLDELITKLEQLKEENKEAKKPNLKEEQNLEKEIESLKNESLIGFIINDFPKTFNQCVILEKHLTGYIDPNSLPKPIKDVELDLLSNLLDISYKPKEDNTIIKGGLDFIINLNVNDNIINERLNDIKYDPITGKVYNESEINVNGKVNIDKKIYERLVNEVPDFANGNFDNMKNEYIENLNKIERFYSKFGINQNEYTIDKKDCIPLFQNVDNLEKKEDITNYIINNIILVLNEINDKKEKKIFMEYQKEHNEEEKEKDEDDIEKIRLHLNTVKTKKEKEKEVALIADVSNLIYREMTLLSDKYNNILKNFIFLMDIQYDDLCYRFNLIQVRFEKFLGLHTDKKKLIKVYIKKFNNFIKRFPYIANHEIVINEFKHDVEDLNNKLWLYVREKQTDAIGELNKIFNVGFFENEMKKFYLCVLDVFKIETEKYLISLEIIFKVYNKKSDEEKDDKPLNVNSDVIFENVPEVIEKKYPLEFYTNNFNIIFINSIKLILSQGTRIKEFESQTKNSTNLNESIHSRHRKRNESSSLRSTHTKFHESQNEDKVKKLIRKEKSKYKFRMQVLKYFASEYLYRLNYATERVHNNMDSWIIKSVRLQNLAINDVKVKLLQFIDECKKIPIDFFDKYPMDNFDTQVEIYDQINYEHILGSKKRESHFHIDFHYDIQGLNLAYQSLKKFNFENNIIARNIFKEMFLKEIFFNRNDSIKNVYNNGISYPLKFLSYKDVMKLVDKFKVSINDNNIIDADDNIDKVIDKENVFEEYINYGGIFTIISIIGSKVISDSEIDNINNEFKDKLIKGKFILKDDFYNYKFWFENDEYLLDKIDSLKDFLFDIWKDEKGEYFNLDEFLDSVEPEKHGGKIKDSILLFDYYNFAFH